MNDLLQALDYGYGNQSPRQIKRIIDQFPDINLFIDNNGNNILHHTCYRAPSFLEVIIKYMNKEAINLQNFDGNTPLNIIARRCNYNMIFFIENNADVNIPNNIGDTPLHSTLKRINHDIEIVRYLVESGANVNIKNNDGDTPLHITCKTLCSKIDVVKYLVENGADINCLNIKEETPLYLAYAHRKRKIVEYLLTKDFDVEKNNKVLLTASQRGHIDIVELFIKKSASLQVKNGDGNTPLHLAKDVKVAKLLVESGVKVNEQNNEGNTPLHKAALNENTGICRLLLNNKADKGIVNYDNKTPYDLMKDRENVSKILLGLLKPE